MVTKHCVYEDCESDSRYWDRDFMKGVCFIRFPDPVSNRERCLRWVRACGRKDLTIESVNNKTFICSKHFIGGNGPTKEHADPLPPQQLMEANRQMPQQSVSSESELITTLLSKNNPILAEKRADKLSLFKDHRLAAKALNDPNIVDLDICENSNDLSSDLIDDLLPLPTTSSASPHLSTHMSANGSANNKINDKHKSDTKVMNGSLPLIIIPSNNQMIGTPFSVPMSLDDEKSWFKKLTNSEFNARLFQMGLHFGGTDKRVTFSAIEGSVVTKQLIVDISGHFDVKVFGLSISARNAFYKSVPIFVQNQNEFEFVLSMFAKWKVCVANEIPDQVFDDKIITVRTFVCNTSNTIRTRNCDLFLPEISPIRCKSCRMLLNRIRKLKNNDNNAHEVDHRVSNESVIANNSLIN